MGIDYRSISGAAGVGYCNSIFLFAENSQDIRHHGFHVSNWTASGNAGRMLVSRFASCSL